MFPPRERDGINLTAAGGPTNHQRLYASSLNEQDSLFHSYEHLTDFPQPEEALNRLRRIASLVKPIMRKRAWKVQVLTEFMPHDERLLGLNINKTFKICIRLRYSRSPGTFLPIEQCVDTMLHELSHIIFGAHDTNFHALWDDLRGEHETLLLRGYTGEGFLTRGHQLGGGRVPPPNEMRRLARASAEKRSVLQKGTGQRIGGKRIPPGADKRKVLADAAIRRATIDRGCASGTAQAGALADQTGWQTFRTIAEEDDANNRAIAEALFDLLEEEEAEKMRATFSTPSEPGGLVWTPERGLDTSGSAESPSHLPGNEADQMKWAIQKSLSSSKAEATKHPIPLEAQMDQGKGKPTKSQAQTSPRDISRNDTPVIDLTEDDDVCTEQANNVGTSVQRLATHPPLDPTSWACEVCTCLNPVQYLVCDACGVERPASIARPPRPTGSSAATRSLPHNDSRRKTLGTKPASSEPSGWYCRECAAFMGHKWWTCTDCGLIKDTSR